MILNEKKTMETLLNIAEDLNNKEKLEAASLDKSRTVLVNIDVINGFCKTGALYSPRNEAMIKPVVRTNELMRDFKKVFFRDNHPLEAKEFGSYPSHCTDEGESCIVDELKDFIDDKALVFDKNSTNGFAAPDFQSWFNKNSNIDTFVVVGDCTDICVLTFVLSLKTYCNQINKNVDIIIPIDSVETFDLDAANHDGDLMNLFALYNMQMNGAKLVKTIK